MVKRSKPYTSLEITDAKIWSLERYFTFFRCSQSMMLMKMLLALVRCTVSVTPVGLPSGITKFLLKCPFFSYWISKHVLEADM
jgi:hypothetical protein